MPSEIKIEGMVLDYNRSGHSISENIGYCLETPLEVVGRLAHTHRIHSYEDYKYPFPIDEESFGFDVQTATQVPKKFNALHIDEFMEEIDQERIVYPKGPSSLSGVDPYYAYNPSSMRFSLRYGKPISKEGLAKAFLVGLSGFEKAYRNDEITSDLYWQGCDESLLRRFQEPYTRKSNAESILSSIQKKTWCPGVWMDNNMSIEKILPILRKIPGYSLEKEKEIYEEFNISPDRFRRPLELLSIFGIKQANFYDLRKFIMENRTKLKK